jgi:ribosomal protein S12 methylthiotransferase
MKVNLVSLGCPKNLVDSENILGALGAAGVTICGAPEDSDIIIINTCGFIAPALEETEATIARMLRFVNNGKMMYVVGCAVNRHGEQLKDKFPGVSRWFRIEERAKLLATIEHKAVSSQSRLPTTHGYAYLKISEGCSNNCAYCTIPAIKGAYRSFDFQSIVKEGHELAKLGTKELIIIGQDTTRYGMDSHGKPMIRPLLRELSHIPGIQWLRLLYAHPKTIDESFIEEYKENRKLCRYVDLPIQHINDRILKLMNRGTDRNHIVQILSRLKQIPGMVIRTTIIVGYPTETDAEYNELTDFLKEGHVDLIGVFPYYAENGTRAADLPMLPARVVAKRYQKAILLQQQLILQKNRTRCGHKYKILVHTHDRAFVGHAEFTAPDIDGRIIIAGENVEVGKFYNVRITRAQNEDLFAERASKSKGGR